MDDYIVPLPLTSPLDPDRLHLLWHKACLDLYRVQWRRAWLSLDGGRMLHRRRQGSRRPALCLVGACPHDRPGPRR
jgi:hypothetical protein